MWCCKCQNDLSECKCPDLQDRLNRLALCEHIHPQLIARARLDHKQAPKREEIKPEEN
jgi:hypothetical protein